MIIKLILIYFVIINIITFALYGIDKRRAVKDKWRIPENTLLGAAFIGGSFGAFAGMQLFRHKTKHGMFRILVPAYMIVHIAILFLVIREMV